MLCAPLLIKDEVIYVIELDCSWKLILETMQQEVKEEGSLA